MNHQTERQPSMLLKKIPDYIDKITKQQECYAARFNQLLAQFLKQAQNLIKSYFEQAKAKFNKSRKRFAQQLLALHYYNQHTEQNHNLYPLFIQIDEKWIFNQSLIQDSHVKISLPRPQSCDLDDQVTKNTLKIYESYTTQLLNVLKSDNVKKYCKKQTQSVEKLQKNYASLFQKARQTVYTPEIKLKKPFQQAIIELGMIRHVQTFNISLITTKGIMTPANYHQLLNAMQPNRRYITELNLKIMDMEFSQEKCDILRKRLANQFKFLKKVLLQNYYKECKLGNFQDFNWAPYRKKVNINAAVW